MEGLNLEYKLGMFSFKMEIEVMGLDEFTGSEYGRKWEI